MTETVKSEEVLLESWRFTTASALAREIWTLLDGGYRLTVVVRPDHMEALANEMASCRAMGRLKVKVQS